MTTGKIRQLLKAAGLACTVAMGVTEARAWTVGPESGKVEFSSAAYQQAEGDTADIQMYVQVRRVEGSMGPCSVRAQLSAGGTATAGSDFVFSYADLTWNSGDASIKNVQITIKHDWLDEPDETLQLTLTNPVGTTVGAIPATVVTITDTDGCKDKANNPCPCGTAGCYDPNGTFQFSASSYSGPEDPGTGNGAIAVQVQRLNGSEGAVTVELARIEDGTASAGIDYEEKVETLSWADGDDAPKTVYVVPYIDSLDEDDDTLSIVLRNPSGGAVLGSPVNATVIILDNDNPPSVSLSAPSPAAAYEGNSGSATVSFTASLSSASGREVSVNLSLGGTAMDAEDYRIDTALPLIFQPGEVSKPVVFTIYGDADYETDETLAVELAALSAVTAGSPSMAAYTITNDDLNPNGGCKDKNNLPCPCGTAGCVTYGAGSVQFSASSYTVPEESVDENGEIDESGHVFVWVDRVDGTFGSGSVEVAIVSGGTASPNIDYFASSQLLTWSDGDGASKRAIFECMSDTIDEDDETYHVVLRNVTGGIALGSPSTAVVTILDNDAPPTVTILTPSPGSVPEGNTGAGTVSEFLVMLSSPSGLPVTVPFSVGGSATFAEDYQVVTDDYEVTADRSVSFGPGVTLEYVYVRILPDGIYEPDETVTVQLEEPLQNASMGNPGSASLNIMNDDNMPVVSISGFSSPSGTEGASTNCSISLSTASDEPVEVHLAASGTAAAGDDFSFISPVMISPGAVSAQVSLETNDDSLNELTETVQLSIASVTGGTADSQAQQTGFYQILDNDLTLPTVTVGAPSPPSASEAGGTTQFIVSLSQESGRDVTVGYGTGGTASPGTDFIIEPASQVSFAAGETQKSISVDAVDNSLSEADETVSIMLSSADGADIANGQSAPFTILDDDAVPELGFSVTSPVSVGEGEQFAAVTFALSAASAQDVFFDYHTADTGEAAEGTDYTAVSGTMAIAAGDTQAEIQIPILEDDISEDDESFHFLADNVQNAAWQGTAEAAITIQDDDDDPVLTFTGPYEVQEGSPATVGVELVGDTAREVIVEIATRDLAAGFETATAGTDYEATTVNLTFSPGVTRQDVQVPVYGDDVYELGEKFELYVVSVQNAAAAAPATVTILDDDPVPAFTLGTNLVVPESVGVVTLPIQPVTSLPEAPVELQVLYAGSATNGADYLVLSPGTVTVTPGQPLPSLKIQVLTDAVAEDAEEILISFGSTAAGKVTITDGAEIAYFKIKPRQDLVLGPRKQIRFTATAYSADGEELPSSPVWTLEGPGEITPAGLYISPESASARTATIRVSQHGNPEISSSKPLRLDLDAPRITALTISDPEPGQYPTGSVDGEVIFSWRLEAQPEEISPAVEYVLLLDDRQEIARFTSDQPTTSALENFAWSSTGAADGIHSLTVLATDAVGNSNTGAAPVITFRVHNSAGTPGTYEGTDAGVDWLLEHQRRGDNESFGSWATGTGSTTEQVIEAAFAAQALAGQDFGYVSARPNIDSQAPVMVAQAYHDAISWLGRKWTSGVITDFVDRAVVQQVLADAGSRRSRLVHHLGTVSKEFDEASAVTGTFATADALGRLRHQDGSFAAGEESMGSRFETLAALRSAVKSRDRNAVESLLRESGDIASVPAYLQHLYDEETRASWSDTTQPGENPTNFYLTAEMISALQAVTKVAPSLAVQEMLFPALADLQTSVTVGEGETLPLYSAPVDMAAALHALIYGRLGSTSGIIDPVIVAATADYLADQQNLADGSWNSRTLDTAWAVRALRPELRLVQPEVEDYAAETQELNMWAENIGAVAAENVRVSAYSADPLHLAPHERARYLLGSSFVPGALEVEEPTLVTIKLEQQETPAKIYLMVDGEERVPEYDDQNNRVIWSLPELPNLAVYSSGITAHDGNGGVPVAGAPWFVYATVQNLGLTPIPVSNSVQIRLYNGNPLLSSAANYLMYETLHEFVDSTESNGAKVLGPGQSATVTFQIHPERLNAARYNFHVWADPNSGLGAEKGSIREYNEFDNIAGKEVVVLPPGHQDYPDLEIVPEAIEIHPDPADTGQVGHVRVRVDNIGGGAADPFDVGVSVDELWTSVPVTIGALPAGQSAVVFVPFTADSASTFTVNAFADTRSQVREQREDNNTISRVFAVVPSAGVPDLAISASDLQVTGEPGARQFAARLRNHGRSITAAESATLSEHWIIRDLTGQSSPQAYENIVPGFELPGGDSSLRPAPATTAMTLVEAEYNFDFEDNDGQPLEDTLDNNIAYRKFFLGQTNLRAISLASSPAAPAITDPAQSMAPVALTATVANGDGSVAMETAGPVHLEIRDKMTSRVLGYWNNIELPSVEAAPEGLSHIYNFSLPPIHLPPGRHYLQAEIDPIGYFVETDETDNIVDLVVDVQDVVQGRPLPDLEITPADFVLSASGGKLVMDVTVRNVAAAQDSPAAGATPPTLLKFFTSPGADPVLSQLPVDPVLVPSLAAGQEHHVQVAAPVTAAGNSYVWVEVDPDQAIDETDDANNRAGRKIAAEAAPASVDAAAIFNTIFVGWEGPVPAPAEYRVARYEAVANEENTGSPQKVFYFGGDVTDLVDEDPSITDQTRYFYRVWARAQGGVWSEPRQSATVETGAKPIITHAVVDGNIVADDPEQEVQTATSTGSTVDIHVAYPGDGMVELYNNFEKVAEAPCEDGVVVFTEVALSNSLNEFKIAAVQQLIQRHYYSPYSNLLVIYHRETLPDISFVQSSADGFNPEILLYVLEGDKKVPITDFSALYLYDKNPLYVDLQMALLGPVIDEPFKVRMTATYENGSSSITADVLPGVTDVIAEIPLPVDVIDAGRLKSVNIKLDAETNADGSDLPEGLIRESSEANNLYAVTSKAVNDGLYGTEFWAVYPFTQLDSWDDIERRIKIAITPKDNVSANQTVNFDSFRDSEFKPISSRDPLQGSSPVLYRTDTLFWDYLATDDGSQSGYADPLSIYRQQLDQWPYKNDFKFSNSTVRIRTDKPVAATMFNATDLLESASLLIPKQMLGNKYIVSSFSSNMLIYYPDLRTCYFQIFAVGDDTDTIDDDVATTVIIRSNHIGFPDFSRLNLPGNSREGEISDDGKTYTIALEKGEMYVWCTATEFLDPTGVIIETVDPSKKIGVVAGSHSFIPGFYDVEMPGVSGDIFAMLPPVDFLDTTYVLPQVPHSGTYDRWRDYNVSWDSPTTTFTIGGKAQNNFTRVVATEDNTSVTLHPGGDYILQAGEYLEAGENALPYYNDDSGWNYLTAYELEVQDVVKNPDNVKRIFDSISTDRLVVSDKPVLATTYLLSSHIEEFDYWSYDANVGPVTGPALILNAPVSAFSTDQFIPVSLMDSAFNTQFDDPYLKPRQYVTLIAKVVGNQTPSVFLNTSYDAEETTDVADAFTEIHVGSTGWQDIAVQGEITYKKCTVYLPTWSEDRDGEPSRHLYVFYNPYGTPLGVRQTGLSSNGAYGLPGVNWNSSSNPEAPLKDIELNSSSVSLQRWPSSNSNGRISVEVLNNGTNEIATGDLATIRLWSVSSNSSENLIYDGPVLKAEGDVIAAKRQLPYKFEIDATIVQDTIRIRAEVAMTKDGDLGNNKAELQIDNSHFLRPELSAGEVLINHSASPGSLTLLATVENFEAHINEVPVRWTVNTADSTTAYDRVAYFTPNSIHTVVPEYSATTTATLNLHDLTFDTDFTVTAHFNHDYSITEATPDGPGNDAENSVSTTFRIDSLPLPNLSVAAEAPAGTAIVGEGAEIVSTVTNSAVSDMRNVPVEIRLGGVGETNAPVVARTVIPFIGSGEAAPVSLTVPVYQAGTSHYTVVVNPLQDQAEETFDDNNAVVSIEAAESVLPDLALSHADHLGFSATAAARGEMVDVVTTVTNVGLSDVTVPYKVQVFNGGKNARTGALVAEGILNTEPEAAQGLGDERVLTGVWDTSQASVGQHVMHLVIDSPDHLAVTAPSASGAASRAPMTAMYMTGYGVRTGSVPAELSGQRWKLTVYTSSDAVPAPDEIIGVYDSHFGFTNTTGTAEGGRDLLEVPEPRSVQVILSAADGASLPAFAGPWPVEMTFVDQASEGTARYTTLQVMVPGNERGQYGSGASFWIADDGSAYHTCRLHLASDFGDPASADMDAFEAMTDGTGSTEEASEVNNQYTRIVTVSAPDLPNLKLAALTAEPADPLLGGQVRLTAKVLNTGAELLNGTSVRLSVRPAGSADAYVTVAPDQVIAEPIYYGQSVSRSFTWTVGSSGVLEVQAAADPDDKILEPDNDDNVATALLNVVSSTTLTVSTATGASYGSGQPVEVTATVSSEEDTSGVLFIDVLPTDQSAAVGTADMSTSMPFNLRGLSSFTSSWNTGDAPAGSYLFQGTLRRLIEGQFAPGGIKAVSEPFDVGDAKQLFAGIQTDRYSYRPGDSVRIRALATNASASYMFRNLTLELTITDAASSAVVSSSRLFADVGPGDQRLWNFSWAGASEEGDYFADLIAYEDEDGSGSHNGAEFVAHAATGFAIDGTGPTLVMDEPTSGSWNRWPTQVTWSAAPGVLDLATSQGIAVAIPFILEDESGATLAGIESGDIVTSEGLILVDAWAWDFAGNQGPMASVEFYIDQTSPTLTYVDAAATTDGSNLVTVSGSGHDFDGSGITDIVYRSTTDSSWTTATDMAAVPAQEMPTQVQFSFAVSPGGGSDVIEIVAIDVAGNRSETTSVTIEGDGEAPQIQILLPDAGTTVSETFDITAHVTDNLSGILLGSVEFRFVQDAVAEPWMPMTLESGTSTSAVYEAPSISSWFLSEGPFEIMVRAADYAGNGEEASVTDANPAVVVADANNNYPPQAPTGVSASYISYTEVEVKWNTGTEADKSHFMLYRGEGSTGTLESLQLISGNVHDAGTTTTNRYVNQDSDLITTPGHYRYALRAYDRTGNSSLWSKVITIPPPDTPGNLVATGRDGKVTLAWNEVQEGFVQGYHIYRSSDGVTFPLMEYVDGRNSTAFEDNGTTAGFRISSEAFYPVTNGETYYYYVVALDGAYNESVRSNIARATPGITSSVAQGLKVRFEDGVGSNGTDWDFADIGATVNAQLMLDSNDNVSTVVYTAVLEGHDADTNYNMFVRLPNINGTATYEGTVLTHNGSFRRAISAHLLDTTSADVATNSVPIFQNVNKKKGTGPTPDNYGYTSTITISIHDPELNPAHSFGNAPYDLWVEVLNADAVVPEYHIFDPQISGVRPSLYLTTVQEDDPHLGGVEIGFGIVIPSTNWTQPPVNRPLWLYYPDFIDYVKSYRSGTVKNINWYENGPHNPN